MERSVEANVAIADSAWTRKALWYDLISEAYYYAAPGLDPYLEGSGDPTLLGVTPGHRRQDHLFDGTLATDAEDHANELCGENFPAGIDWAELHAGNAFAGPDQPRARVRDTMQTVAHKVFRAIHASNFYLSLNTMAMDAVVAGTGLMKGGIARDSAVLIEWEAVCQAEVALEPGARGTVGGFHRKMDLTRDDIRTYWPEASPLPPKDDEEKTGKPTRYRVNEAVYYDLDDGIWRESVILRQQGRSSGDAEIYKREYMVCPWICWRYALLPGEVQGRGPVFKAVPSARTVNHAKRVRLETASIRAVPAYTFIGEDAFNPNTVEIGPGVFIPVGSNDPSNPTIRALEMAGDVPLNELVIEDERNAIHAIMMRNAMPDPAGPVRSATEFLERRRDHIKRRGADTLRMTEEIGRPVLRLVAFLLQEAGQLPELAQMGRTDTDGRPVPFRLDGTDVSVQFTNPMVGLQRLQDAQTITQWAETVGRAFGPEALMAGAKVEEAARVLAQKMNVPEELVREQEEAGGMIQQQMAAGPMQGQAMDGGQM